MFEVELYRVKKVGLDDEPVGDVAANPRLWVGEDYNVRSINNPSLAPNPVER